MLLGLAEIEGVELLSNLLQGAGGQRAGSDCHETRTGEKERAEVIHGRKCCENYKDLLLIINIKIIAAIK